jgi:hypothetical protein
MISALQADASSTEQVLALAAALMLSESDIGVAEVAALAEIFGISIDNLPMLSRVLQAFWGGDDTLNSLGVDDASYGALSLNYLKPFDNIAYIIRRGGASNVKSYTNLSITLSAGCNELLIWQQSSEFTTTACTALRLAVIQELPEIFNGQGEVTVTLKYTVKYTGSNEIDVRTSTSTMYVGFAPRFGYKCCRPSEVNCRIGCAQRQKKHCKCKGEKKGCGCKDRPNVLLKPRGCNC